MKKIAVQERLKQLHNKTKDKRLKMQSQVKDAVAENKNAVELSALIYNQIGRAN